MTHFLQDANMITCVNCVFQMMNASKQSAGRSIGSIVGCYKQAAMQTDVSVHINFEGEHQICPLMVSEEKMRHDRCN